MLGKTNWKKNQRDYYSSLDANNAPDLSYMFTPGSPKLGSMKGALGKYWNKSSGIQPYNLGKASTALGAAYNVYGVGKGLSNLSKAKDTTGDLKADIIAASHNNPMLQYDLDPEQLQLLRQLRRGSYDDSPDTDLSGILGGAVQGGLYGLAGGIPGVVIGAIGGGANAAVNGRASAQEDVNDELEALYASIMSSEQEYNNLRKQRMLQSGIY